MTSARPVALLQEVVDLLRQLADQGRAWSADDLLTAEEARRRLRAGKDNRDARALLDPAPSAATRPGMPAGAGATCLTR